MVELPKKVLRCNNLNFYIAKILICEVVNNLKKFYIAKTAELPKISSFFLVLAGLSYILLLFKRHKRDYCACT